jgi:N-acyl-D-amino-acid deacylase
VKAKVLAERPEGPTGRFFCDYIHQLHDLGPDIDFEPGPERRIVDLAAAQGRDPFELAYDLILTHSERPQIHTAFTNYAHGNLNTIARTLTHPSVVLGLSDAGAHVTTVCDGTLHSFMLTHWARDRRRGPRVPVETLVHLMTQKNARSIGLHDRGTLAPGAKADVNVIDLDALTIDAPRFVADLPAGASRLLQKVTGYRATIVSGTVTREYDVPTSALPGKLVRHAAMPT